MRLSSPASCCGEVAPEGGGSGAARRLLLRRRKNCASALPHHRACGGPPLPHACGVRASDVRSRGALAPEFLQRPVARIERSEIRDSVQVANHSRITLRSIRATKKGKRNAGRRMVPCPHLRMRRAPLAGALACRRSTAALARGLSPLRATPGQASWDAARAHDPQSPPNRGRRPCALTGVTRARLSQSRECTSRTGRSTGPHDARSRPDAECIVPRAGTALAPPSGVPSRWRPLDSSDTATRALRR